LDPGSTPGSSTLVLRGFSIGELAEIGKKATTAKIKLFIDQLNKLNKPLKAYQALASDFSYTAGIGETTQETTQKKLIIPFVQNSFTAL